MTRKASSMAMRRWLRKVRRHLTPTACQAAQRREADQAARWAGRRERRP